jgi:hypothetical protein
MALNEEISEIIEDVVSRIDTKITGTSQIDINKVAFCSTKWARKDKSILDVSDNPFKITEIDYDVSITAQPEMAGLNFVPQTYYLPNPYFIGGTKIATNNEWTIATNDLSLKTPIVWLLETINERQFGKEDARLFESELRIFFLDETNITDFYSKDHRREVVYPMKQLGLEFLKVIKNDRSFKTIEDYSFILFSRFGVEQEQGMFQNVLDANLSGVELRFTLTKYKENCKC